MRAVAYSRVSSMDQVDGTSLESQDTQLRAYAAMKGFDLVGVLSDPGVSGSVPLRERPAGEELMRMVESGEVEAVIITKLDRGFRDTIDCLQTVKVWDSMNIGLHVLDMGGASIDTQSSAGKFMLTVLAAAAEMERKRISERCETGRAACRKIGKRLSHTPFGYDADENGILTPNKDEQEIIRLTQELKALGMSAAAIARELNNRGVATKSGEGKWSHSQIGRLLKAA